MMYFRKFLLSALFALAFVGTAAADNGGGDARKGGKICRACLACHSLRQGVHLTGPSLAGLWGAVAGDNPDYVRYSKGLNAVDFRWDEDTLIAFLSIAMARGGYEKVIEKGLAGEDYARGQQPPPLRPTPAHQAIVARRHCGDAYFIKTANGAETTHWEKNIRLKVDSQASGPAPGVPAIIHSGMRGDRFSAVFSSLDKLKSFIQENCK